MISYKGYPTISRNMICSFDRMSVKRKRKVLENEMEVTLYLIAFLLVGGPIQWVFENETERDFVWENVIKILKDDITKIDNY